MKKYIKIGVFFGLLVLSSCTKDFLETEPYTDQVASNFYKTPSDGLKGLVSVYDMLQRDAYGGALLTSEIASDDCFGGYGVGDGQTDLEWDRFLYVADKEMNKSLWQSCYQGIYRANILLENLNNINWGNDATLKTKYEAEAKFLRAYFHFQLVRMFGTIVTLDHSINTSEFKTPRSSAEVTYALIANDLKFASNNLGNDNYSQVGNANYGRITKWAAESLLARVFLFYTDYYNKPDLVGVVSKSEMIGYINDVVNNSGHNLLPNFANLWRAASLSTYAGEGNTEMVWAVRYNSSGAGNWGLNEGNRFQVLISLRGGDVGNYATGWGGATVTPSLYDAYLTGDSRKNATIINISGENLDFDPIKREQRQYTGYAWKKYSRITKAAGSTVESSGGNFQIDNDEDYAVIRFADVLLMAAELNLASNPSFSQTCLDRVRDRAFKDNTHRVTATYDNIMNERRLELALEGSRYFDLIRQSLTVAKTAIDNNVADNNFKVTFRPETLGWFPLPQSQIVLSDGTMAQNPGW